MVPTSNLLTPPLTAASSVPLSFMVSGLVDWVESERMRLMSVFSCWTFSRTISSPFSTGFFTIWGEGGGGRNGRVERRGEEERKGGGGRRRGREEGEERKNGRRGKRGGRREEGEEGRGEEERKGGERRQKVRERERERRRGCCVPALTTSVSMTSNQRRIPGKR